MSSGHSSSWRFYSLLTLLAEVSFNFSHHSTDGSLSDWRSQLCYLQSSIFTWRTKLTCIRSNFAACHLKHSEFNISQFWWEISNKSNYKNLNFPLLKYLKCESSFTRNSTTLTFLLQFYSPSWEIRKKINSLIMARFKPGKLLEKCALTT